MEYSRGFSPGRFPNDPRGGSDGGVITVRTKRTAVSPS